MCAGPGPTGAGAPAEPAVRGRRAVYAAGRMHRPRIRALYRRHFRETPRERLFLASVAFFVTFGATRLITHAIRAGIGPFHDLSAGQTHIHHLVWASCSCSWSAMDG